jgi:1,4-dihydroxy-6-naphthoate synthase
MKQIKIGISPCPNDIFVFSGLLLHKIPTPGYEILWDLQDVETLNQYSELETYDVLKISAAQWGSVYQNSQYTLLHCGGAMGYGCGPLLLQNGDDMQEQDLPVLIPGERTTAHFLYQFYKNHNRVSYQEQVKDTKRFLPFDQVYQLLCETGGQQGVVIHECRFTYERDGLDCVVDLGAYWEKQTGCPIPLGVLVAKVDSVDVVSDVDFSQQVEEWVRASLQWANHNTQNRREALDLCKQHAQEMSDKVMEQHIQLYVNAYTADIGKDGKKAIDYLLHEMKK